jgi:C-5 cytosine-specific DNA methylase
MPTLNAFDNGDIRTTVLIMRNREGKPGGGKGPMLGEKSFTLATNNDQTLFIFYGNRVDDIRIQDGVINTLQARMGTGGNNMPMIFSHTQGLDPQPSEEVSPTLRRNGNGMAVAYDEFNDSIADTHHTLRSGTKQSTGVVMETQVRRLTPLECERLQGFPDDWTASQSDSARYKQMGNAVAVPVVEWIIQGIVDTLI